MSPNPTLDATARLHALFAQQKQACLRQPFPSGGERRDNLRRLKQQLGRYQSALVQAMSDDFGGRSAAESEMLDLLSTTLEINHALTHLGRWMRPSKRHTELLFATNHLEVRYQPKGVVGIIGTWNFPIYLSLGPLAAALAAGNRALIKMPSNTPATTRVVRQMLAEVFPESLVAVMGGELENPNDFSSLPFDHIVFTGSPRVGRTIMQQASQNLTPVTLELGGKSPAIVLRDYPMERAARSIVHGKCVNAGQICVSPDYALVPQDRLDAFIQGVNQAVKRLYQGQFSGNRHYTSMVSERHAARIRELLDDARRKGAKVVACGQGVNTRQIPLHIVTGCTPDMLLMQEEIFGPILPVLTYNTVKDAIAHVQAGPRPLALYCYTHDVAAREQVLGNTHSGGVTLNDWGWHVLNHDAPFGGIGNSGMGTYHGQEGFRELSHARTVFKRHRWFPIELFHPPYGNIVQRLAIRLFVGKPDRNVPPSN